MSTDRTRRLSPSELALKLACREAVKAASVQDFVAGECSRTQSRISDWCSPNTAEFMPIDVIQRIEALGAGAPGHPHVTRALARAQGLVLTEPDQALPPSLAGVLGEVAGESADVIQVLAALAGRGLATIDALASDPAQRGALAGELDQLIALLMGVAARLGPAPAPALGGDLAPAQTPDSS